MDIGLIIGRAGFEPENVGEGKFVFSFGPEGDEIRIEQDRVGCFLVVPDFVRRALEHDFTSVNTCERGVIWNPGQIGDFLVWLKRRQFVLPPPTTDSLERLRKILGKAQNTERAYLRRQRLYQDRLREYLLARDKGCVVTGITEKELLVASHIVPWGEDDATRLDTDNLLLLSAAFDKAFDSHLISFDDAGRIVKSDRVTWDTLEKIGIKPDARIPEPNENQKIFLRQHRKITQSSDPDMA